MIAEDFKKYLSGFFDGDGSITVEKFKNAGYTLRIKFCQSNEDIIKTIQRAYPFMHYDGGLRKNRQNNRCEYQLRAAGKQIESLVDDLLKYSILKYEQLLEAKKFFKLINVKDKCDEKETFYNKLKELKKVSQVKPYERINIHYISGLFDAEGSIGIYSGSLRVKITQKSDTIILQTIADKYNNKNKIDNYAISFYGENSLTFLNDIKDYCIYKKPQILAAINYINTLNFELTDEIMDKRQEYENIISNEKTIDTSPIHFKNQESHKVYLRNCFDEFLKLSYLELLNYCKMVEIQNTKVCVRSENQIYDRTDWNNFDINPVFEFCETNKQIQMYQYYRKKVSSLPLTGVVGRAIRILVKDSITDKYIGIMCLSSDVYNLGERDAYIKKTANGITNKEYLKNIMNLSCCVPLQPFGFNTTGGKLLASLAFSKEIFDYYFLKYKEPLLAIITTSINGKSIQYDRLRCLKLIGYTKGYGSVNIPDNLYKVCQEYNNIWKVVPKSNRIDRFNFLKNLLSHLGLSQNILQHNNKRGIYFGYLFSSKLTQTYDINELKNANDIFLSWKTRWCNRRINTLLNKNSIKNTHDLYTLDSFKNSNLFVLPKIKERVITDNLIKEVLSYKSKPISQDEVCKILNNKYNTEFVKSDISRIYTGKIVPEKQDDEYIRLVSMKSSKNKLADDEIYFILDNKYCNYSEIVTNFNQEYNKQITKASVSDIINEKIKPIVERKSIKLKTNCKFKMLNDDQIITVIGMKSEDKTTQEVSDFIKNNYKVYINRNLISKLWNGEDLELSKDIINSNEYQNMLLNHKRRTVKNKKFTSEETKFLKTFRGSLNECCNEFEKSYNKTVTRAYVSKLKSAS
jgi:hypothetical protein